MNRTTKGAVVVVLALAACGNPLRADPLPQETNAAAVNPSEQSNINSTIIDDLDLPDGTTLEQALDTLKRKVPGFDYISRKGSWQHQTLPKLHLTNVRLDAALGILTACSGGFYLRDISPQASTAIEQSSLFGARHKGAPLYMVDSIKKSDGSSVDDDVVQVFSLSAAVDRQANLNGARGKVVTTDEARKLAMNSILSLIENALKQSDDPAPAPTLSVHDQTETLIAKGNPQRVAAVAATIKALDAPVDQAELRRLQSENSRLFIELRQAREQIQREQAAGAKSGQSK